MFDVCITFISAPALLSPGVRTYILYLILCARNLACDVEDGHECCDHDVWRVCER